MYKIIERIYFLFQIQYLESHLHQLTDERGNTENFQKKIKDENTLLMSRYTTQSVNDNMLFIVLPRKARWHQWLSA